ncbi:MAG: phosphoribosylamine--glycine ligase [Acidobacteriaceae bacterium]|nr:phosphoribosylamine--glycine ligase [Acidobacteriaceae bacterium]
MKILIVGGGGREHALAWRLSKSPSVKALIASPGNPGIAQIATCVPAPKDVTGYAAIAESYGVDVTIVGPEALLVAGIVDHFHQQRLKIIGPTREAAKLEGSKVFAKRFLERTGIPTARAINVDSYDEALLILKYFNFPVVIKADGLAAGKGVIIAQDHAEAAEAIQRLGPDLVIEEFLEGEEVSFIGISNGQTILPLAPTQDHKRIFNNDQGPNTGGMGAYVDSRILSSEQTGQIMDRIMIPAIVGMRESGTPFTGFLYAGLMLTADGPKVLEFNVRLGDPETQALMHSFRGDFADFLGMMVSGVGGVTARAWGTCSVCVVLAAAGYPDTPRAGDPITGIEEAEAAGATIFQAGTKRVDGRLVTSGGRVLGVTAAGDTLPSAIAHAYDAVQNIHFEGMHYRTDIGQKGVRRW